MKKEKKLIIQGHSKNPFVKFWNWGWNIYYKNPEVWNYLIVGFLTMIVSFVVYYALTRTILDPKEEIKLQIANFISWAVAVVFAYFTNRRFVFKSQSKKYLQEFTSFVGARIITLVLDMLCMFLTVSVFLWPDIIGKVISQVLVTILNYFFSKIFVFKGKPKA